MPGVSGRQRVQHFRQVVEPARRAADFQAAGPIYKGFQGCGKRSVFRRGLDAKIVDGGGEHGGGPPVRGQHEGQSAHEPVIFKTQFKIAVSLAEQGLLLVHALSIAGDQQAVAQIAQIRGLDHALFQNAVLTLLLD